jgi:bacterioferritin
VTTAPFLSDLAKVRARTREHAAAGADDATQDRATVLRLLNDVLASELIWLMRYRRRFLLSGGQLAVAAGRDSEDITPADRLARRIVELGGRPDLDPDRLLSRSRSDFAARGSVDEMIREDLRAERIVIESYTEVIDYVGASDPSTRRVLDANLGRERARAAQLSQLLRDLETPGVGNTG